MCNCDEHTNMQTTVLITAVKCIIEWAVGWSFLFKNLNIKNDKLSSSKE